MKTRNRYVTKRDAAKRYVAKRGTYFDAGTELELVDSMKRFRFLSPAGLFRGRRNEIETEEPCWLRDIIITG